MPIDRALLLHHDPTAREELVRALDGHLRCELVSTTEEALGRFASGEYSVVVVNDDPPRHDHGTLISTLTRAAPHTVIIVISSGRPDDVGGAQAGKVFRFLGNGHQGWQVAAMVLDGVRLARLEREQRELMRRLGGQYDKLQKREKLLDHVVKERTRELEHAYLQLKQANRQLLLGLAEVIEAKDSYTTGHCGRVANYSMSLARRVGFKDKELEIIEYASFLHDIGKIGVRDAVLQKPGPLGDDEWTHMRTHPVVGDSIVAQIDMLRPMRSVIRNHHERWDGTGYPDRMQGEDIPLPARIVTIADAFDAMITERPYKTAIPFDECCRLLRKGAGKHFDPDLVELFVRERIGEELEIRP